MFVIVRHGNTFAPEEPPRRIGARTDLPLTQAGLDQAHALARYFVNNGVVFGRALFSPLTRTWQTAEAILAQQKRPPSPVSADFLREIDYGCDENKLEEEVRARIGADALAAWDCHAKAPDGWRVNSKNRLAAWRRLFDDDKANDHPTLLVTSNGAARFALLCDPDLANTASQLPSMKLPTGGFGIIERRIDGKLHLKEWGKRP